MYNNEQVLKVFRQNFISNMPKNGYILVVNPPKSPRTGGSVPRLALPPNDAGTFFGQGWGEEASRNE